MIQRCIGCGATYPLEQIIYTCAACGQVLEIALSEADLSQTRFTGRGVWRYEPWLPVDATGAATLQEGDTGLYPCDRLAREVGIKRLFIKNEGDNPTGSFKDRGMTVGVTWAAKIGAKAVACASTGNTSASMAAYAARMGIPAIVLIPDGKVAMGKLAQAVVHGARVVQVQGNFDDAMRLVQELSLGEGSIYLLNSINPFRLEGQKTLALEVYEALDHVLDAMVLPMGNAGNISAIWKGFSELHRAGLTVRRPRMIGVQAAGAAPIVATIERGADTCKLDNPETIATAIRIGAPVNWRKAVSAVKDSDGEAGIVTDDEILAAQRDLARLEGIFVEPASAAPIAYLRKRKWHDVETVVCVTTGHGLKDPDAVLKVTPQLARVAPTLDALRAALGAA